MHDDPDVADGDEQQRNEEANDAEDSGDKQDECEAPVTRTRRDKEHTNGDKLREF